jgi:hypothetical protein
VTDAKRTGLALSAENLSKRFGDRVAFDDVSFEIGYGEVWTDEYMPPHLERRWHRALRGLRHLSALGPS